LRDFIYVEDVARANLLALEGEREGVYNVRTGKATSILEVANTLIELFDKKLNRKSRESLG
jgi:nucleoside-diphosphate-sugar epimerase